MRDDFVFLGRQYLPVDFHAIGKLYNGLTSLIPFLVRRLRLCNLGAILLLPYHGRWSVSPHLSMLDCT